MQAAVLPILLLVACVVAVAVALLVAGNLFSPGHSTGVKRMPYESGMDPVHDTRRRFDVRFHLLAIAFLVFDVELLFLYPWAVALRAKPVTALESTTAAASTPRLPEGAVAQVQPGGVNEALQGSGQPASRPVVRPVFVGGMVFVVLLTAGFLYDWRKGVFRWR